MADDLRVMVVDDEPLAVERLQLLLARLQGVAVVGTANDGEAALRIAEAVAPDLVLLDIAMPGMDGIDVARALSQSAVDPAVVFVTAFDNFAVAAFDVAAIDYLMKPVQTDRLERALERVRSYLTGGKPAGARPAASPFSSTAPSVKTRPGSTVTATGTGPAPNSASGGSSSSRLPAIEISTTPS